MRIEHPAVYNPFGWRLAEIADPAIDAARGRELSDGLVACEAEELALGRRHLTIVHGDPDNVASSRHLAEFYDTVEALASSAEWARVRGTAEYMTITIAGSDAERMIMLMSTAAERASPGWWKVAESPYPDAG